MTDLPAVYHEEAAGKARPNSIFPRFRRRGTKSFKFSSGIDIAEPERSINSFR